MAFWGEFIYTALWRENFVWTVTPSVRTDEQEENGNVMTRLTTEGVILKMAKAPAGEIHMEWTPATGATTYRVARGTLRNFYDHTVDDPSRTPGTEARSSL